MLGAVVTGDTDHDQVVAHTAAQRLSDVGLQRDTPVTFGVGGPVGSDRPSASVLVSRSAGTRRRRHSDYCDYFRDYVT
ncbi:hypothetical protein BRC73_08990 [Halobacteriales archaeon QH_7_66_37]|nr:MAG: hypothetical protein BRC73_08990 [Halobacteriales archaeon QH_7_66_37]